MNIRVKIPKEITSYEPKMLAGMSARQLACAITGIGLTLLFYNTIGSFIPNSDLKLLASGIIIVPFFCLGWIKPYGMKFEKFIGGYIRNCFLAPAVRKYKTENIYETMKETNTKKKKKYKKSRQAYK